MSMDVEMITIPILKWKRRQYFDNPAAISRYRTRYRKYRFSPPSRTRKKDFSICSKVSLRAILFALAFGMWAGIQILATETLIAPMERKSSNLSSRDLRLLTIIKESRLAMICERSCV